MFVCASSASNHVDLRIAIFQFIVAKVPNIARSAGSDMARTTPQVEHDLLSGHGGAAPIAVGSPAWFAWLEQSHLFAFRSSAGSFTARREGRARGGGYWRAYRTIAGRQRRAYLGRAADLTSERLHAAAIQLAVCARTSRTQRRTRAPLQPHRCSQPSCIYRDRAARWCHARGCWRASTPARACH